MKQSFLVFLFVVLCSICRAQQAPDGYYYDSYYVFVTVHEDNSYSVIERLNTYFTEQKHGIFRSIPNSIWIKRDTSVAQDRSGTAMYHYNPKITDIWVNSDYSYSEEEGLVDIRIGSADKLVEGLQSYLITYEYKMEDDRVPQADLFFHSLLGTGNPCTVKKFGFRIYFDKPLPEETLKNLIVYSGPEGDTTNVASKVLIDCTSDSISGWVQPLEPFHGVSFYAPLPEGYFDAPVSPRITWSWIFIVLASIVLLYVLYKEIFRTFAVTPVVTFYPPQSVSSAEVGTIFDCSADDEDLISLIPWFANYGYLSISENKANSLILKKIKDLPADAPLHQRLLFDSFFAKSDTFDTSQKTSIEFGKAWLKAKKSLNDTNKAHYDHFDLSTFICLLVGILLSGIAVGFADTSDDSSFEGFFVCICYGVEAFVLCMFVGSPKVTKSLIVTMLIFMALGSVAGPDLALSEDLFVPRWALYSMLLLGFIASLFAYRLSYMSEYRRSKMGEILGLQEFIRTADSDRLKQLLSKDGRYFYQVLPYAIAFGMADRWAAQFANLTVVPTAEFSSNVSSLASISSTFMSDNIRYGIKAEETRIQKAQAVSSSSGSSYSSSGSSYSSSRSYSSGGRGYSGGGSGGGGSRSW